MTRTFDRKLNVALLKADALRTYPLLARLLALWAPAGTGSQDGQSLRLAIRDGYVNFYAQGQSLAEVKFHARQEKLGFRVHKKYCGRPEQHDDYVTVPGETAADALASWHRAALDHPSKKQEKIFVDALVGANDNAIDVEMALPAQAASSKVAPRADLVMLEPCEGGYRLVFWEAKLSVNSEARAQGEATPKVVGQLQKYADWLGDAPARQAVVAAYARTCALLVSLHELAQSVQPDIAQLSPAIRGVGAGTDHIVELDPRIRLVIEDRTGEQQTKVLSPSFAANGHEDKLVKSGIPLRVIRPGDSLVLAGCE